MLAGVSYFHCLIQKEYLGDGVLFHFEDPLESIHLKWI